MSKCFDSWKCKSVQYSGARHLQKAISDKLRLRSWLCWRRYVLHGMYIRLATERSEAEYNMRLMKRVHDGWLGAYLDSAHSRRVDAALRQRLRRNRMLAAFKELSSNLYRMLHLGFCETKIAQVRESISRDECRAVSPPEQIGAQYLRAPLSLDVQHLAIL
jgi:hypothetical protein